MSDTSTVVIARNGFDITNFVVAAESSFESQINAVPGTFEITCRDPDQVLDFVTGDEITLDVDGVRMYGGYLTLITHKFAFAADDTTRGAGAVQSRLWVLRGVDYNVMFDKRVMRDSSAPPDSYLRLFPLFAGDRKDGDLIRNVLTVDWLDIPPGFDTTSRVDDVVCPASLSDDPMVADCDPTAVGAWLDPGTTWRKQMESFAKMSGVVWYMDPDKKLNWHALETFVARWGFSDVPNHLPVDGDPPGVFAGATYGFREIEAMENGETLVNDAMIWGGTDWSGTAGGTVFAREQNAPSEAAHGRWQYAETHFGDSNFASDVQVDVRAQVIVNGQPGNVGGNTNRGLSNEQWRVSLTWFGKDVPLVSGQKDHLVVGNVVVIDLQTFGLSGVNALLLPLRQIKITFPALHPDGTGYVKFEGTFALQLDDPWSLWKFLLGQRGRIVQTLTSTVDSSSVTVPFGATFYDLATETPDGVRTLFSIPFGYVPGTLEVWVDGNLQTPILSLSETDPAAGTFTLAGAPLSGSEVLVLCKVTG